MLIVAPTLAPPPAAPGKPSQSWHKPARPTIIPVLRHLLAPVVPACASRLDIPRTLGQATGVALTFDDGPHPQGTPAILKLLEDHRASATFFLVGEQVQRRPQLAREIADRGHLVALHGHRHRLQPRLPATTVRDDLRRGAEAIQSATGTAPKLHRPPFGIYSPAGLEAARAAGLQPLLWSRWGKDWRKFTTPTRIATRVTGGVAAGDVILLHDADFYSAKRSHERTAAALPLILGALQRREIATVLPV
jgi:peptidoglycan/xylan/chitin deacetylase (PgdA/CDA1 family)